MALRRSLRLLAKELLVTTDYHGKHFISCIEGQKWSLPRKPAEEFKESLKGKNKGAYMQKLTNFSGRVVDLAPLFPQKAAACDKAMVRVRRDCELTVQPLKGALDALGWNEVVLSALQGKGGIASDVFALRLTDFEFSPGKAVAVVHVDDDGNPTVHLAGAATFAMMRPAGGAWFFVKSLPDQQAGDAWLNKASESAEKLAVSGVFAKANGGLVDGKREAAGWKAAVDAAEALMLSDSWQKRRQHAIDTFAKASGVEVLPDDSPAAVYALLDGEGVVQHVGEARREARRALMDHVRRAAFTACEFTHKPTDLAVAHCEHGEPFFHVVLASERDFKKRRTLLAGFREKLRPRCKLPLPAKEAVSFYKSL